MGLAKLNLNGLSRSLYGLLRLSTPPVLRVPSPVYCQHSWTALNFHTCVARRPHLCGNSSINFSCAVASNYGHGQSLCFNDGLEMKETDQNWKLIQTRYYGQWRTPKKPSTLRVSFDYSGDQTMSAGTVDLSEPRLGYEKVEELKDADEYIKKIFSLEFAPKRYTKEKLVHNLLEKVKEHELDRESLEVIIAKDTVFIRNGIQHCLKYKKDKVNKSQLIKRIVRRRTLLKILKSQDIEKFNWLTSELQIKYVDPGRYDKWKLSKRAVRKKMARDAALALRRKKMEEFQKKLGQEKVVFDKYRDSELAKIEAELKEFGISELTSLQDTLEALNLSDMLPKPPQRISRRRLILQKKFELYGEQKKILDDEILKANGFLTNKEMPYLP